MKEIVAVRVTSGYGANASGFFVKRKDPATGLERLFLLTSRRFLDQDSSVHLAVQCEIEVLHSESVGSVRRFIGCLRDGRGSVFFRESADLYCIDVSEEYWISSYPFISLIAYEDILALLSFGKSDPFDQVIECIDKFFAVPPKLNFPVFGKEESRLLPVLSLQSAFASLS